MKFAKILLFFLFIFSFSKSQTIQQVEKIEEVNLKGYIVLSPQFKDCIPISNSISRVVFKNPMVDLFSDTLISKHQLKITLKNSYEYIESYKLISWLNRNNLDSFYCKDFDKEIVIKRIDNSKYIKINKKEIIQYIPFNEVIFKVTYLDEKSKSRIGYSDKFCELINGFVSKK